MVSVRVLHDCRQTDRQTDRVTERKQTDVVITLTPLLTRPTWDLILHSDGDVLSLLLLTNFKPHRPLKLSANAVGF